MDGYISLKRAEISRVVRILGLTVNGDIHMQTRLPLKIINFFFLVVVFFFVPILR